MKFLFSRNRPPIALCAGFFVAFVPSANAQQPSAAKADPPNINLPGRLSALRNLGHRDSVTVANAGYSLDIQKVFKVSALVPKLAAEVYGQKVYAGAMNLRSPGGSWLNELPASQYSMSGRQSAKWLAEATQTATVGAWSASLTAKVAVGYPAIWFEYRRLTGAGPLSGGLMGYDWAGRTAPTEWAAGAPGALSPLTRPAGSVMQVPVPASTKPFIVIYHDAEGIQGCLRFDTPPAEMHADDTGISWTFAPQTASADVEYLPISAAISDKNLTVLAEGLHSAPTSLAQIFGADKAGSPSIQIAAAGSNVVFPAALGTTSDMGAQTVEGYLSVTNSDRVERSLPVPPQLESLTATFSRLPARDQARVDTWIKGLLKHQLPGGSFGFSEKRGFYDGMVCCALAEVYPQLSPKMQALVKPAVRKGLDHLWLGLKTCEIWPDYKVAPEQPFFIKTGVDYPEIMGFLLQATALYCRQVDPAYLAGSWPQIVQQFEQLRVFTDWTGNAYANPGPDFYQIIPEGSIGGYLGWHALYHLAKMHHSADLATEARARAAFAWSAINTLYTWQPFFGDAVVNGINNGAIEVRGASPWTYFQYTWFTFLPAFSLPHADTFHIWAMLNKMPWNEWTGKLKSRQRANDGANMSALLRANYTAQVKPFTAQLLDRPVWYDAFDFTPTLMIPAQYWANKLGK